MWPLKLAKAGHTAFPFPLTNGVNDVRQTEIDAAEPLVPETSAVDLR